MSSIERFQDLSDNLAASENVAAGGAGDDLAACMAAHWKHVYRLLYRMAGNAHDAEDLAQEALVRAIERKSRFTPGTNLRSWLLKLAANVFLDQCRKKRPARADVPIDEMPQDARGPEARLEGKELGQALAAAIARLPHTPRAVFVLRAEEDLSFREIGEAVGVSEEAARWHMMQARRELVSQLDGKL